MIPPEICPLASARESMAMPRAFVAKSARARESMAQPTTRRLKVSMTTQQ
jgi:hypothetical protein